MPYRLPVSSTALSSTGRISSISYMLSTPCRIEAIRSRPMPVSMFFFGSSPARSKSSLVRNVLRSYCMKTLFQYSMYRSSSTSGPPARPYSGPRS